MIYKDKYLYDYISMYEPLYNKPIALKCTVGDDMRVETLLASFGGERKSPFGHIIVIIQGSSEASSWDRTTSRTFQEYNEQEFFER